MKHSQFKVLLRRQVAYNYPHEHRLPVGARVIAVYRDVVDEKDVNQYLPPGDYYSGIIAEPPKIMNKFR